MPLLRMRNSKMKRRMPKLKLRMLKPAYPTIVRRTMPPLLSEAWFMMSANSG